MSLGKRHWELGSIPTAPTVTPDDSVALTLLGVQKGVEKQGILFPSCSQVVRSLRLGQLDSGARIATIVLSRSASHWLACKAACKVAG